MATYDYTTAVEADGVLLESWDAATDTYTRRNRTGAVLETRPLTTAERAGLAAQVVQEQARINAVTIRQQAADAMAGNRIYAALTTPTAAQTTAQVKSQARQLNGVIRLLLNQLDGTD